jgi:flagella basal body P-ring formation protein FlgA
MSNLAQLKTILCFTMITLTSFSADAAEICLRAGHRCEGDLVRLGDVAEVREADAAKTKALAEVELFPAPGRLRMLRLGELKELLALAGVDVAQLRFSGETAVTIYPAREVRPASLNSPLKTPSKTARPKKEQPPPSMVVVPVRPLRKGELVRPADIELRQSAGPVQAGFSKVEEVVGKETTRALATGQVLEPEHVRAPVLVQRGEVVRVIAKAAGVRVKTNGKALQDGSQGELIEVQPLEGKQRYMARVVDYQQVEVYAQGPSAE